MLSKKAHQTKDPPLTVQTVNAAMGVRGTEFFVAFGKVPDIEPDLWMCVNEGKVEVKSKKEDGVKTVNQGEGILLPNGSKITDPKAYAWTQGLNWNMNPDSGELDNPMDIEKMYTDLLDEDYD